MAPALASRQQGAETFAVGLGGEAKTRRGARGASTLANLRLVLPRGSHGQ